MKVLGILAILIAFAWPVRAQQFLCNACVASGPTVTGSPVSTPTPAMDPSAITGITNCPPTIPLASPPSVRYPAWVVDQAVASVNVTDNGVQIPNPNPIVPVPTALYRVGGQPTGFCLTCGYFIITYTGGTHTLIFTAKNDAGQVINSTIKVVQVGASAKPAKPSFKTGPHYAIGKMLQ